MSTKDMTGEGVSGSPIIPSEQRGRIPHIKPIRGVPSSELERLINATTAGMYASNHAMDSGTSWWDRLSAKFNRRKAATVVATGTALALTAGVGVAAAINQPGQQPGSPPEFAPLEFDWSAIPLPRKAQMESGGFGITARANHIAGYEGVIGDKLLEILHKASGFRKVDERNFLGTKTEFFDHQEEQPGVEVLFPDLSRKDIQTIGIRSLRKEKNSSTGLVEMTGGIIPGIDGKFIGIDASDKENPVIKLDNGQKLTTNHQFKDGLGNQYRVVAILQDFNLPQRQRSGDRIAIQKYTPKY